MTTVASALPNFCWNAKEKNGSTAR